MKQGAFLGHGAYSYLRISKMCERKPENRLDDPGSYLAQTRSQAIAANILDEIIRLKELCSHMDIIVRRLIRRPLLL